MRLHLPGNAKNRSRQLEQILQEIPQKIIRVPYSSIPHREAACIQARGFITPINIGGASENFPARKQGNDLCAGSGPIRGNQVEKAYIRSRIWEKSGIEQKGEAPRFGHTRTRRDELIRSRP
ncbi:hypothetical protein TNCV_2204831 [Trichonephila clavipes]|nr:hypothetical protein TNCV_2204831 [Trichonephila clavipes]